jgi:large subunit ribosomal protein L4
MSPATVPDGAPETEPTGAPETEPTGAPEDASAADVQPAEDAEADDAEADDADAEADEVPVAEAETDAAEDDEAEDADAEDDEADAEDADAGAAPARAARRRAAKAGAGDDEATAKAPSRPRRAVVKPEREAPQAAYGLVEADLPADIFDAKVNIPLIHQVVVAQQAAARQGTHSTKSRGDVRGGGRKPYRQKGTGRARQGSTRAPQFAGGGVVHGPVPRSYAQKTPKKMKAAALRGALSDRARHGLVQVVEGFVDGADPKTRDALAVLNLATEGNSRVTLVVAEHTDQVTWRSLRNAPGVHLIDPGQLNTYDVLVSDRVVFTTSALAVFVARAGRAREDA